MYGVAQGTQKNIKVGKLSLTAFLYTQKIKSDDRNDNTGPDQRSYFFTEKYREYGNEKNVERRYKGCSSRLCSAVDTELLQIRSEKENYAA